jgi:hypothetical protein
MLFANESASPLKESLAYSLVSFYFRIRRVSLAEYLLVLRALFPLLLQMAKCTMDIASTVYISRWATTRIMGVGTPYVSSTAFVGLDRYLALYLNSVCVWGFETNCFRYFIIKLGCNNFMF